MPKSLAYSPIAERPPLAWPGGARLAFWVVPNIEHYAWMPAPSGGQNPWPRMPHPDVGAYGVRDYGNRVGFDRMMPLMKSYGLRPTLSLNTAIYELFPAIRDACEAEGYEVMCHGRLNTDQLTGMGRADQKAYIELCQAQFEALTGRRFPGWFSPANTATVETAAAAADAGLAYIVDYFHDDQPTLLANGRIVCLPYTMDLNDGWNFRYAVEAEDFVRATIDQFEQLYAEGDVHGRVMSLPLHPFVFGQPHRIRHLERILDHIASRPGVWHATGSEIAAWYLQQIGAGR
jgi:peptidoglycan/xylan/chitin deacetylase (PgdA/CDA1 family)